MGGVLAGWLVRGSAQTKKVHPHCVVDREKMRVTVDAEHWHNKMVVCQKQNF